MSNLAKENAQTMTRYSLMPEDNLAFQRSDTRNLLLFKTGTATINKPAATNQTTIDIIHNLGYIPASLLYTSVDNTNWQLVPYFDLVAETYLLTATGRLTTTKLTFALTMFDPAGIAPSLARTQYFKYYLFREKAS